MNEEKRRPGFVCGVKTDDDHNTIFLMIDFDGATQGFGGIAGLRVGTAVRADFVEQLCKLFDVTTLSHAEGKHCWALYAFGKNNEDIEGLENTRGQRFTLTSFRKKHWPEHATSPLAEERSRLQREHARIIERARTIEREFQTLGSRYTDWETEP